MLITALPDNRASFVTQEDLNAGYVLSIGRPKVQVTRKKPIYLRGMLVIFAGMKAHRIH